MPPNAFAQGASASSDFIVQLVPLFLLWIVCVVVGFYIGRRKGKGLGRVIIGTFPLWGGLYLIWLASLTDKDVLERLARLEGRG
jgi:hypothetical protein